MVLANTVAIEPIGLLLALGFLVAVLALSKALRLGLEKAFLIAALRCYVQLSLLGLVLVYLFAWDYPWLTGMVFGFMIFVSSWTIRGRLREIPVATFKPVLFAVAVSGILITFLVTAVVIQVDPFWKARYWLPLGGMVLGNSMNGIALSVERLFAEIRHRRSENLTWQALGAGPWECLRPSVQTAMRAGLIPAVNNMAVVGVVSIPGMMTGQVLAGAPAAQAARYQVVVMLMIAAASATGSLLAVLSCARLTIDEDGVVRV
ncbi:MAG: iron export ABC transporter permease subunit FetB [Planctomycetota bacterium]|nr:MAG: iron export ABC transporter permease subunit FetB [Planctomycetota bacterium]